MLSLDQQYQNLLVDILNTGLKKEDRTGTGTLSVFGRQFRHKMSDGFPLLTTKKMPFKLIVTELLWFLRGDTNIKYLIDNGCNIWNGDAYKKYTTELETHYLEGGDIYTKAEFIEEIKNDENGFAKKWGELGPIYGKQWRDWDGRQERDGSYDMSLDQMANLIFQLKRNPDSRRLMVNAWNVGELSEMTLPPCHYGFQVYTRELSDKERYDYWFKNNYETGMEYNKSNIPNFDDDYYTTTPKRSISLMWNQRSVDTFLGLPFNIASYGLLLEILAKEVGMVPDELIGNFGDVHLYSDHLEQATEQLTRVPCELSSLVINDEFWNPDASFLDQIDHIELDDFYIKDYQSHKRIKAPLSN